MKQAIKESIKDVSINVKNKGDIKRNQQYHVNIFSIQLIICSIILLVFVCIGYNEKNRGYCENIKEELKNVISLDEMVGACEKYWRIK